MANEIRDQTLVAGRIFPRHNNRILNGGVLLQQRLDFRQLDPVAADLDLLVEPSAENSRRWIVALSRLPDGAARELAAEPDVFAAQKTHAVRINDEITVDVLPSAAGVSWEALREHVGDVELDGVRLRVLSLEGLLKTKTGARPKDQMDAAAIRRALQELGRG